MRNYFTESICSGIDIKITEDSKQEQTKVVVIGSGYAGVSAVQELEKQDKDMDIHWVSDVDYHLVLHESHRCISDPMTEEKIRIPIEDIKTESTDFTQGRVRSIRNREDVIELEDGSTIDYDYLVVSVGSSTAFFGIDGVKENSLTLKSLDDALKINHKLLQARRSKDRPKIVIGGGGLTGIQIAGEVKKLENDIRKGFETHIVEGMDSIYPGNSDKVQRILRDKLVEKDVHINTGNFVEKADPDSIKLDNGEVMNYDVFIWAGGIEGRECNLRSNLEVEDRSGRIKTKQTLQSSDPNVFVAGDAAYIERKEDTIPPKAQAAWDSGEIIAQNIANHGTGKNLQKFCYEDKGTVISIGEDAVAHDLDPIPFVNTLQGKPAVALKKSISSQWISSVTNPKDGIDAWSKM